MKLSTQIFSYSSLVSMQPSTSVAPSLHWKDLHQLTNDLLVAKLMSIFHSDFILFLFTVDTVDHSQSF